MTIWLQLLLALGGPRAAIATVSANISPQQCADQLKTHGVLNNFHSLQESDLHVVGQSEDATRIRLQFHSDGRPVLDRPLVLLIHGLYNSPKNMLDLEDLAYQSGFHVINLRLPGHCEKCEKKLDRATKEQWLKAVEDATLLASEITDSVYIIGHSTGAASGVIMALRHPQLVKKLVLLAPAFKVARNVHRFAKTAAAVGLSGWVKNPKTQVRRYVSSAAGLQVVRLAEDLMTWPSSEPAFSGPFAGVIDGLKDHEILWIDTVLDAVIDLETSHEVSEQMMAIHQSQFQRVVLESAHERLHDDLCSFDEPAGIIERNLIRNFLGSAGGIAR
jgi:pimeloyl-ACP methyl ester carboxylesterase